MKDLVDDNSKRQQTTTQPIMAEHTVKPGDTLSQISVKYYGPDAESHWMVIYQANLAVIGDDPNMLQIGMRLKIPELVTAAAPATPQAQNDPNNEGWPMMAEHIVKPGDTLNQISVQYYGPDGESYWQVIYQANLARIGEDPDMLQVGMRLQIPELPEPTGIE